MASTRLRAVEASAGHRELHAIAVAGGQIAWREGEGGVEEERLTVDVL